MNATANVADGRRAFAAMVVVFVIALAMRIYYVNTAMVVNPIRGDATQYFAYAWNLVHHGVFSMAQPGADAVVADSFRDPGYPVFLALLMTLFKDPDTWYGSLLLLQATLGAVTVVLAMASARDWLARSALVGAGIVMAVWPHSIAINAYVLSETLFSFLLMAGLAALAASSRADGRAALTWGAIAGLLFAAAGLTNAVLAPAGPIIALILCWKDIPRRRAWLAMLACAVVPLLAWHARGAMLPEAESSSHRALMNFVQGSWPEYHDAYRQFVVGDPRGQDTLRRIDAEYQATVINPRAGLLAIGRRIGTAPGHYLAWYAGKPWLLWGWGIRMGQNDIYQYPTLRSPFDTQPVWRALISLCATLNPLIFVLAAIGVVVAITRERSAAVWVTAGLLVFCTIVYAILQSEPRYATPLRPLEFLSAVLAIAHIGGHLKARRRAKTSAA